MVIILLLLSCLLWYSKWQNKINFFKSAKQTALTTSTVSSVQVRLWLWSSRGEPELCADDALEADVPNCSMWPGAAIIKGGKHPGVFTAACPDFIKSLTTVGRP